MAQGRLYLIPTTIAPDTQDQVLSPQIIHHLKRIDHFLVEDLRSARRFIGSLKIRTVSELSFQVLDKNTNGTQIAGLMSPLLQGHDMGVLSEAGCPAVADPGHLAVAWAHKQSLEVVPLVGPSSIMLALMGSGLNGQNFEFHGYLPIESGPRKQRIRELEKESRNSGKTQIFMETPYRNQNLMEAVLSCCHPSSVLCVACSLTDAQQLIKTKSINSWRQHPIPDLHKKPTMFLLQASVEI